MRQVNAKQPNLQQVGHELPNLQSAWLIYAELAVSMAQFAYTAFGSMTHQTCSRISGSSGQHWQLRQFIKRRGQAEAAHEKKKKTNQDSLCLLSR